MTVEPRSDPVPSGPPPARDKTGIPKNPGRRDLGMKVSLLFPDRDIVEKFYVPVIYTACRTCYSEEVPEEIFEKAVGGGYDPAKMQKLISSVIESGHGSTIEHVVFTFAITGVSRTLSHQLVRHRAGVAFSAGGPNFAEGRLCHRVGPNLETLSRSPKVLQQLSEPEVFGGHAGLATRVLRLQRQNPGRGISG